MSWEQIGGSLVAILVLALIARALKLGESRIADADTARRFAEAMLVGFTPRGATIVSTDGGAALVAGNGAIAVLKRHGAHVAARRLIPPLALRETVEGVIVDTGERMFGPVLLFGVITDEVRALESQLTRV